MGIKDRVGVRNSEQRPQEASLCVGGQPVMDNPSKAWLVYETGPDAFLLCSTKSY